MKIRKLIQHLKLFSLENVQRASTLSYYTALSIVPVFAVLFGIAKGFGVLDEFDRDLSSKFAEHQEIYAYASQTAKGILNNADGGLISAIGALFLLWSVIKIFTHIEITFNQIWQVEKNRSIIRQVADYIALIVLLPLLLVSLSGVLWQIIPWNAFLVPPLFSSLLFTLAYAYIPNCNVRFSSALIGGLSAGILYQIVQTVMIQLQIGVSSYNAIYGSFAAVPLFLVWVQLSWLIVLAGAFLAYHWQTRHSKNRDLNPPVTQVSDALKITTEIVDAFSKHKTPPTVEKLSKQTGIPSGNVSYLLILLCQKRVLMKVDKEGYAPAIPLRELKVMDIVNAILGIDASSSSIFHNILSTIEQSPENALITTFCEKKTDKI